MPSAPSAGGRQAPSDQVEEATPVHTWRGGPPGGGTTAPRPQPDPCPDARPGRTRPADQSSGQRPPVRAQGSGGRASSRPQTPRGSRAGDGTRAGRAGGSDAPAWTLRLPCLPSRRTSSQKVLNCASPVHLPAEPPRLRAGPPPRTLRLSAQLRERARAGFWGWGRPPARLVPGPAREPAPVGGGELGRRTRRPAAGQECAPPRHRAGGPQRRGARGVLLALWSVALPPAWLAPGPPALPEPTALPAPLPPFDPRPSVCFPARRWGWGRGFLSHVGDGRSRPRSGRTPASHSRAQASTGPGALSRPGSGEGPLPQHTPAPQATALANVCAHSSAAPGVGCLSRRGARGAARSPSRPAPALSVSVFGSG